MLAIWRVHGLDAILHEAWCQGTVLCGISAGSMCWFSAGVTKSSGRPQLARGLGFLPGSNSVHWRSELDRRPAFKRMVAAGEAPAGWGVDDGAAMLFAGTELVEMVSARPEAGAWRIEECLGEAIEVPLDPVILAQPEPEPVPPSIAEFREERLRATQSQRRARR
jgi:peptidase E